MGDQSAIEWTEATWNPWQGCHKVSAGCKHCYMFREKKQYGQNPAVVIRSKPHTFNMPLRLKTAARVFTCSWSDFFIEEADEWRLEAWDIIAKTPHLTYQILTKRPERMAGRLPWHRRLEHTAGVSFITEDPWPNVWLGVSVEDQATADARIPLLLQTPAAIRWVSYEPALGPVDFANLKDCTFNALDGLDFEAIGDIRDAGIFGKGQPQRGLDWLVVGGESGPGARPFDLAWARQTIAQCRAAGVPVFMKQAGSCFVTSYYDEDYRMLYEDEGIDWPDPIDWDIRYGQPPLTSRVRIKLEDRKGGNPIEWPEDLRVREYPTRNGVTP